MIAAVNEAVNGIPSILECFQVGIACAGNGRGRVEKHVKAVRLYVFCSPYYNTIIVVMNLH